MFARKSRSLASLGMTIVFAEEVASGEEKKE